MHALGKKLLYTGERWARWQGGVGRKRTELRFECKRRGWGWGNDGVRVEKRRGSEQRKGGAQSREKEGLRVGDNEELK